MSIDARAPCALIAVIILNACMHPVMAADKAPGAVVATTDAGIEAGRQCFEKNRAIFYGFDAHGNGPFAELLNVKPPDLTSLSRAQGGDFPFSRVCR